ncbi:MAG: 3-hydroxyacyl-CoA dehydrogenase NAD-binding domain-containing protein [Candidatus Sericytochromatia bacterium]|nr:3-hydroxyacyl-CoA dehydrogenase NAD-binding domain-containing protein [Candidatus Sericytochromatia bacterium]
MITATPDVASTGQPAGKPSGVASLGVLGAGTMGAGIAQVALAAGLHVRLYDPLPASRERAAAAIAAGLERLANKGRLTPQAREAAVAALLLVEEVDALAGVDALIEAVPEDLNLKRRVLSEALAVVSADALVASNTSSLSITALAAGLPSPGRVVGLHFFNPVAAMALVEVVRGDASDEEALRRATALVTELGKTAIACDDTPGFIVNRVARPFYGEALRLVGDHGATPEAVDQVLTLAAGFKMGPFALMDLIGIDVNLAVSTTVWEAFYGEPRFRPHPLQRRMVDSGRLGRKVGRGFYAYPAGPPPAPPPAVSPAFLRLAFVGQAPALDGWARALHAAGHAVAIFGDARELPADEAWDGGFELGDAPPDERAARRARLAAALPGHAWLASDDLVVTATEVEVATGRAAWRLASWPVGGEGPAGLEVAFPPHAEPALRGQVQGLLGSLGRVAVAVPDLPGLVGPRTVAMLVNEAAFAVEGGVAAPEAIDLAMRLGTGYPLGPLAWADAIGPDRVVALLRALQGALGERYRPAPWLVRRASAGWPLADAPAASAWR